VFRLPDGGPVLLRRVHPRSWRWGRQKQDGPGRPSNTSTSCATSRLHCNFGIDLINQIKLGETRPLWTAPFPGGDPGPVRRGRSSWNTAYAEDHDAHGSTRAECADCSRATCATSRNRRCQQNRRGSRCFEATDNPFPLDERDDRPEKKERNFFETRPWIEYQTGGRTELGMIELAGAIGRSYMRSNDPNFLRLTRNVLQKTLAMFARIQSYSATCLVCSDQLIDH